MNAVIGPAVQLLGPLLLFGLAIWLVFKALEARFTVVIVVFLVTYALAESSLGLGVWHWLGAMARTAGLPGLLHHL